MKKKLKQKRIIITPYKISSRSAKLLQQVLKETTDRRVLRVRKTSPTFHPRQSDYNINWGNCFGVLWANPQQEAAKVIARNKLKTFKAFKDHGVPHPEWTINHEEANAWNCLFVGRTLLEGHSGNGIVMFDPEYPQTEGGNYPAYKGSAKLYVKYKKKKHEYRVHVFNGQVIDVAQKKRKAGFENRNNQIRNHANGWIFARENITEPGDLREVAVSACNCIGLLYGAVDIIWNEKENKCYALEINTAPGIEGTTLQKYSTQFKGQLNAN